MLGGEAEMTDSPIVRALRFENAVAKTHFTLAKLALESAKTAITSRLHPDKIYQLPIVTQLLKEYPGFVEYEPGAAGRYWFEDGSYVLYSESEEAYVLDQKSRRM